MSRGSNRGLGVDFNTKLHDGLVNNRGVDMIHEIGLSCTCQASDPYASTQDDGTANRTVPWCSRCGSTGFVYRNPRLITGLFVGARYDRNILDLAVFQSGDATFSPRPVDPGCEDSIRIGPRDKLTSTWPQPLDEGQVIIRGAGTTAANQGIETSLEINEDRLWYEPAKAIWCEDEDGNIYNAGADFELGPGRIVRWVGGSPAFGKRFVIKYSAYFEWVVFNPPQERRDRYADNLGEVVPIRKKHAIFLNEPPQATSMDKQSLQAQINC